MTAPGQTFAERVARRATRWTGRSRSRRRSRSGRPGSTSTPTPRGALVEAVAIDVPAAKTLASGDVIVEAAGRAVSTVARSGTRSARRCRATPSGSGCAARASSSSAPCAPSPRRTTRSARSSAIRVSQDAKIELPVDVQIDLGDVGGPSAGLPFALEVYQELGNDVDRGYRVAATGEIELDGTVVPVGGIKQKTFGVRSSGRGRVPRPGWGKRGDGAAVCRGLARDPCGEF